jgi:hypothetical protein
MRDALESRAFAEIANGLYDSVGWQPAPRTIDSADFKGLQ